MIIVAMLFYRIERDIMEDRTLKKDKHHDG
jgi:hypothetical protein